MRQVESLTRGNFSPKGALNIALLDGAAKRRGQPLSEFFGLSFAEGKHVSSITIGLDSPSMTRQKVREAGSVPHIKAQVGSRHDVENLAALRESLCAKQCEWTRMKRGEKGKRPCVRSKLWRAIRTLNTSSSRCLRTVRRLIFSG